VAFSILIVDDEPEVCLSLTEILTKRGYDASYEVDPVAALDRLQKESFDLAIVDIRMPALGGIDLLRQIKNRSRELQVIIISGHATVENAVLAMKYGALNLYTKPIRLRDLLDEIQQLSDFASSRREVAAVTQLVTQDSKMKKVLAQIEKVASTDASVLLTGESGTGKDLLADTLHRLSRRSARPYLKINCAAIPESLLESEMFGYEKGAFTDAREDKTGKLEAADGGTVFFDEVGDMSASVQAKMLRVMQDKEFSRVGSPQVVRVDCRFIAATNKDLGAMIRQGTFREDLFYRLSVVTLQIPPLRERMSDILLLAEHFIDLFSAAYGKGIQGMSREVAEFLTEHDWPGNVRELKNCIERAVIFADKNTIDLDTISFQHKDSLARRPRESQSIEERYQARGKEVILEALDRAHGVKSRAAELLQIDRKTLYNRMRKLGLS
jgi:DNA-binding NtrC family response regulator